MRIIARSTLRDFWMKHPDSELHLRAWFRDVQTAVWNSPADVKQQYVAASILPSNRVVFNIRGNVYRLIAAVRYDTKIVYIRFIGTHAEYDRVDAPTV